jgi:hypothetical protein
MSRNAKLHSPRRKHGPSVILGRRPRRRLRSDEPEEFESAVALARSRPCTPCKARGTIVAAHRIMPSGEGRCDECYRAESRK